MPRFQFGLHGKPRQIHPRYATTLLVGLVETIDPFGINYIIAF